MDNYYEEVTRELERNANGHVWRRDEDGYIDIFVLDDVFHNGPGCIKCGESFCRHCDNIPPCTVDAPAPS